MKNFDKFDDSVKNKLDGMDFSFNESNWEKMNQMIDANLPVKKTSHVPLISAVVIALLLTIGTTIYFLNGADSKQVAQNTNTVVSSNDDHTASTTKENTAIVGSITTENKTNTENLSDNITQINNTNSSNSSSTNNETKELSVKNKNTQSVNSYSNKKNTLSKNSATKISDALNLNKKSVSQSVNNNNTNSDQNLAGKVSDVKTEGIVGETEGAHSKVNVEEKNIASQKSNSNNSVLPELGKFEENTADIKNIETNTEENDLISLPSVTTSLGQTAETIAAANLKTAIEDKKVKEYVRVKHHTVNLEGGAINSFGWAINETRNGNNISPLVGVNYIYNIDSRSSLLVGLQYNSLSNLGEAKANFSVTTFGFGLNNDVTTYKLSNLQYAVMPLKYIYKINKNNAIGVGANMMYLMNTRTEIIHTTAVESNINTTKSRFENGYGFDQLNIFNAQLALSYRYSISNKIGLGVEVNKALGNVVKDYKYFGVKQHSSAPAAIKLSLTYTLFNK